MTLYAFGSTHGSPGVTSTVVGLAAVWGEVTGRSVLLVEAEPDGGVLAARFEELRADRTLADVAVEVRRTFELDVVLSSAQHLWSGVPVVVAPPSAEQASSALAASAERLASGLASIVDLDVLVDVGRLSTRSPALPFARRAVTTVLLSRATFEAVTSLTTRASELRSSGCDVAFASIGEEPYRPQDVATAADVALAAALPDDARAASILAGSAGSERRLRRSLLFRTLADLASRLVVNVPTPVEHVDLVVEQAADLADATAAVGEA